MVQAGDPTLAIPGGSEGSSATRPRWRPSFAIVGVAVLANGGALLFHILRAAPLPARVARRTTAITATARSDGSGLPGAAVTAATRSDGSGLPEAAITEPIGTSSLMG
jgi:hypothetical protein